LLPPVLRGVAVLSKPPWLIVRIAAPMNVQYAVQAVSFHDCSQPWHEVSYILERAHSPTGSDAALDPHAPCRIN
jgi:hypothetical protein